MEESSTYTTLMLNVAQGFEVIAALVFIAGLIFAFSISVRAGRSGGGALAYRTMRQTFGSAILLGLEILVAGDLIRTVAVAPTLDNVVVLAIIVLIRTFLSFSLEIEIEGVPPWRRGFVSGATMIKTAVKSSQEGASATESQ